MSKGNQAEKGLVYFMRRADGVGPVKIGCSKWPQHRLKALQIWSPETLEIVASAPGTFADETRLHRQFAKYRLHGEWFEAAAPVLAAVARAAALGELPPKPADDRNVLIMSRFEAGETLQAIGDDLGITRERVRQLVKKEGGKARGQGNRGRTAPVWSQMDLVRRLATSGSCVRDIAAAVGDSRQNVYIACRQSGIALTRGKKAMSPKTIERAFDIAAQYKAGVLGSVIAAKHGIPQPTIYRYLRIAGVKPKRNDCRAAVLPWSEIVSEYRDGATMQDLVARHGSTSTTIRKHIERAGALRSREENEAIRVASVRKANLRRHGVPRRKAAA